MKILFLSDNFPPETNAPATRTYEHCVEWVKKGEEVTVITCFPNFPKGKVFKGYKNKLYQKEIIDGITVIRVWSYIAENKGFIRRIFDFTSFALMSFIFGLFIKTDVIIATSPQFFTTISAQFLSFFKRKFWIMEVRDLWPDSIVAVGSIKKNSIIYRLLSKIEFSLYKNANKIVVVTNSFYNYLTNIGISNEKIAIIPNGIYCNKSIEKNSEIDLKAKLGLKNKFVISYIGTHGMAHGLSFILNSISEVDRNIHFLFIGDGAQKKELIKLSDNLKLNNVTFLDSKSKSEIDSYIEVSDAALVNLIESEIFENVIPSKIFENVYHQKPILLGVKGEAKELIEKYKVGVCFDPENKSSFLTAIELVKTYSKSKKYAANCKKMLKLFDRKNLAKSMLEFIKY